MARRLWLGVLAAALGAASPADAAQTLPPVRSIGRPAAEHPESFTLVSGLRELPDGRVYVSDLMDRRLVILDFSSRRFTQVGRVGSGPGEYRGPTHLFAVGRDSTGLSDPITGRLIFYRGNGDFAGEIRLGATAAEAGVNGGAGFIIPEAADRSGRFYYAADPLPDANRGVIRTADSIAVLRMHPATARVETIGKLGQTSATMQMNRDASSVRAQGMSPFSPRDTWAVAEDGAIAFIRATQYRVDWHLPNGNRIQGPVIVVPRVRVTEEDKANYRRETSRTVGSISPEVARMLASVYEQIEWPEFKPPFAGQAVVAPDGKVWVPRTSARAGDPIVYDVFDRTGKIVDRVQFPARSSLHSFSATAIYAIRVDQDDLMYLQKFVR